MILRQRGNSSATANFSLSGWQRIGVVLSVARVTGYVFWFRINS
jgi:hypothetical protein